MYLHRYTHLEKVNPNKIKNWVTCVTITTKCLARKTNEEISFNLKVKVFFKDILFLNAN